MHKLCAGIGHSYNLLESNFALSCVCMYALHLGQGTYICMYRGLSGVHTVYTMVLQGTTCLHELCAATIITVEPCLADTPEIRTSTVMQTLRAVPKVSI